MTEYQTLAKIMGEPLPKIYVQKRLLYRPNLPIIEHVYDLLNRDVFENVLIRPTIKLGGCRKYWGMCLGEDKIYDNGSFCTIKLMNKWYCVQWMVTILAHEMAHQWQWDVFSKDRASKGKERVMSHGPSFYRYQENMRKHNISLCTAPSLRKWFKHQDLFKC